MDPKVCDTGANSIFTPAESMFIIFSQNRAKEGLNKNARCIYLSITDEKQKQFNKWVTSTYPTANLTPNELQLAPLVKIVWDKIYTEVFRELRQKNDNNIDDEYQWTQFAEMTALSVSENGIIGKYFTPRQANFIVNFKYDNIYDKKN